MMRGESNYSLAKDSSSGKSASLLAFSQFLFSSATFETALKSLLPSTGGTEGPFLMSWGELALAKVCSNRIHTLSLMAVGKD
ncbi:hypothetical protein EYF80_031297 [Liparis tanakae]|uniref:Uncharacterized protein n=1 Tax=Liparis tanakae TaxID=230148 RepID=A0A4Z2H0Y1_9TELE|nr:hypothetical protein EYF80_031297 [Liparis tanakae]